VVAWIKAQPESTQANALNLAETSLQDTREALELHEVPTFIYSYLQSTDQLHRANLVTGELSCHRVPSHTFKMFCYWSEVPGGSLLITGGGYPTIREVVRIDTVESLQLFTVLLCSLLEEAMLQCITLHISISLEEGMTAT
jgi:hypothetical protein